MHVISQLNLRKKLGTTICNLAKIILKINTLIQQSKATNGIFGCILLDSREKKEKLILLNNSDTDMLVNMELTN